MPDIEKWDKRLIETQKNTITQLENKIKVQEIQINELKSKLKKYQSYSLDKLESVLIHNKQLENEIQNITKLIGGKNHEV